MAFLGGVCLRVIGLFRLSSGPNNQETLRKAKIATTFRGCDILAFRCFLSGLAPPRGVFLPNSRNLFTGQICEKLRLGFPSKKKFTEAKLLFYSGNPNLSFSQIWPAFKFRKYVKKTPWGGNPDKQRRKAKFGHLSLLALRTAGLFWMGAVFPILRTQTPMQSVKSSDCPS